MISNGRDQLRDGALPAGKFSGGRRERFAATARSLGHVIPDGLLSASVEERHAE